MEITCPYPDCGKKFDWECPEDTDVYKMLTAEALKEKKVRRYVITCLGAREKSAHMLSGEEIFGKIFSRNES